MSLMRDEVPVRGTEPGEWMLTLPGVTLSANVLRHMHWAKYAKVMEAWFYLVRGAEGFLDISRPTGKRWVVIERHGKRDLDRDNLYSSVKPLVDVLRPPLRQTGVRKSGPQKGQSWDKSRIGHGLILEDDDKHLELVVKNALLKKRMKPYMVVIISDSPIVDWSDGI
jgi:hypothetical protein